MKQSRRHALFLRIMHISLAGAAAWAGFANAAGEEASSFPSRPLKIVVPFPPGGTADLLPRALGEKIGIAWKQPVVIDNKPGASGNIGAKLVADAPADGYTMLFSTPGPLAINEAIYRSVPFDPSKFVPASVVATAPVVLAVRPGMPANSVQELVAMATSAPGKLSYASSGAGSTPHLVGAMFASTARLQILHVPYKGTAPALTDLIGGQVDMYFDNLANALQYYKSGRIKILAVASARRSSLLPSVPTMAEAGLPGFTASTWYATALPPGTPPHIAARWNAAIHDAVATPDMQRRLQEWGLEIAGGTPADAAAFIKAETVKWKAVAADAKVLLD